MTDGLVFSPALDLEGHGWSPDDAWLAVWDPGGHVRCLDPLTGRAVLTIPGAPVGGVAWPSPEVLWVIRADGPNDARVIAHAVPDGGVLGVVKLPNGWAGRQAVTVGAGGTVLVTPRQWHLGPRKGARLRLGYLLRGDPPEIMAVLDPDALDAQPSLPCRRQCMASLSPDGGHVVLAYGGALTVAGAERAMQRRGEVVLVNPVTRQRLHGAPGGRLPVDQVLWAGPTTVVVRGGTGLVPMDVSVAGEVLVLDLSLETVRFDTDRDLQGSVMEGDNAGDGGVGWAASVDVHPDRGQLAITGRAMDPKGTVETPRWQPCVRSVDVATGMPSRLRRLPGKVIPGAGVAWLGDGTSLAVLTASTAKRAVLHRWPDLLGEPVGPGITVALEGTRPTGVRLARSPAGRWLTATWTVTPAPQRVLTRVALVPSEALTGLSHG